MPGGSSAALRQRASACGGAESRGIARPIVTRSNAGSIVVVMPVIWAEKRPPSASPAIWLHRLKFANAGLGVGVGGSGVALGSGVAVGMGEIVGVGEGPTVAVGVSVTVGLGVSVGLGVADGVDACNVS